ncbi:hypothetical protein Mucpa_1273 [Mucilaginibacter paludis DSM 18603]|uniref:Transposase n=1 Tax=Mucilaginibacter paludis DSM 18603 TaxID=714943 RepID=H1YGQ1_9SPHI|nr:PD-(D/E)XK nuclease family transposase [Mucilaginibacter paludis]EHQ25437.1 hypothetical protein Mucpa_1273 [Mucilaginibacter paludis DSM 18603]
MPNEDPAVLNKRVFQQVFKIAELSNLTEEEKAMYDSNLKAKWDYENSISFAEERGIEKGREEGMEKGIEKGTEKGKYDVAIEMKKEAIPVSQIAKFTKLSIEVIEKL